MVVFKIDKQANKGFTLIELMIVIAIVAALVLASLVFYRGQLAKGRDAKRKASLDKMQKILEDYLNDAGCYPDSAEITTSIPGVSSLSSICNGSFSPYSSQLPCDSLNNRNFHFFYSIDSATSCKKWYKIYTRLEITNDPVIEKLGCSSGCGPSDNFNYWVSSPNVESPLQQTGEAWPEIPGVTPYPSITPTAAPPPVATATPTPPAGPTATPTPPVGAGCQYWACFDQHCQPIGQYPYCAPNYLHCESPPCMGEACCNNDCPTSTKNCGED